MSDQRIDLSSLDPSRDHPEWNTFVESVAARARAATNARGTPTGPLILLWRWRRLTAASAALAAGIAAATIIGTSAAGPRPTTLLADIPRAVAAWVDSPRHPSPFEIYFALNGTGQ